MTLFNILDFIYRILKEFAKTAGFNLVVTRIPPPNTDYETVTPFATYAPWLSDHLFNETYEIIKNYTLIDKYKCYELWELVEQSAKLNGALIEVGVWRGGSGALIAKKAKLSGIKDNIYLCDTFTGVVKAGGRDSSYKGGEHADASKETVKEVIHKLDIDSTKILMGVFPEETSNLVSDKTFRFCHVDVDVYQSTKDIVEWLWPKLVVGGIVIFDDYGFQVCNGVTSFVNEMRDKRDRLVIHNLNGHAIIIKISG